jgi:hypothetical protein
VLSGRSFADVSEVLAASIALVIEAASTSEMSVNFYHTIPRNKPEDSHLHTRHCENLKSHLQRLFVANAPVWLLSSWRMLRSGY